MTAPTMQQPVVPPRPSKSPAKEFLAPTSSSPVIPPRPANKRLDRSKSPNPDRFAQSPFTDGVIPPVKSLTGELGTGSNGGSQESLDHNESVPMPSVGEEGLEYSLITSELQGESTDSAEQTRSVAEDLKLHAPKPSLPASSAKERLKTVTRTDSDKAASFGIGKPGYLEGRSSSRNGLRKKSSTSFSTTSEQDNQLDDEHGIPEIGQRVPMNPHLGDVQAPSPAPGSEGNGKNHNRRHSSRGLPPGSYGMHGHGVESQDELDKAYYKKHPELLQRELHTPLYDRQNDFAMSSNDLNKLVRDTANRRSGIGWWPLLDPFIILAALANCNFQISTNMKELPMTRLRSKPARNMPAAWPPRAPSPLYPTMARRWRISHLRTSPFTWMTPSIPSTTAMAPRAPLILLETTLKRRSWLRTRLRRT